MSHQKIEVVLLNYIAMNLFYEQTVFDRLKYNPPADDKEDAALTLFLSMPYSVVVDFTVWAGFFIEPWNDEYSSKSVEQLIKQHKNLPGSVREFFGDESKQLRYAELLFHYLLVAHYG